MVRGRDDGDEDDERVRESDGEAREPSHGWESDLAKDRESKGQRATVLSRQGQHRDRETDHEGVAKV